MRSFLLACCLVSLPAYATTEAVAEPAVGEPIADSMSVRDDLARKRAMLITQLRRYAEAGRFPINDFQTGLANQFMDDEGNLCAMAHLMSTSGRYDLMLATSATANDLRFETLTDGPVYDWVLTSGLLLEEAAMVQVPEMPVVPNHAEVLFPLEVERQRSHLRAVAATLELTTDTSLDTAVQRLTRLDAVAMNTPGEAEQP